MKKRIVLITGASRGIGASAASAFAQVGYSVCINYLQSDKDADGVLRKIIKDGGDAELFKADVSDPEQVSTMVQKIVNTKGNIDVLINNAGITRVNLILKSSFEDWKKVVETNLSGAYIVLKECARNMINQKSGTIINISSIAAVKGAAGAANYSASKAGIIALTKSAAKEFGRFNIRVNAVMPGFHGTDMGKRSAPSYVLEVLNDNVLNKTTAINELMDFLLLLSKTETVSGQVFNWDARII